MRKTRVKKTIKVTKVREASLPNAHAKDAPSKKQQVRKREWDETHCTREIAESDMDFRVRHHIELHIKPVVPTVVQVDSLSLPTSASLRMLLSFGGKFVPHSSLVHL